MKMKNRFVRSCVITGIFLFVCFGVTAQDLTVRMEMIESRNFPKVEAVVHVEDPEGNSILSIVKSNIRARVDLDNDIEKIELERYAATERPIHYYVLITNSGLTRGQPLSMQKEAIMRIFDSMGEKDTISVYTVGPEPVPLMEDAGKDTFDQTLVDELDITEKQAKLYDSLSGMTRIVRDDTVNRSPENSRAVVILLSDGRDQESRSSFDEVVVEFDDLGFPIYSMGIRILGVQKLQNINTLSNKTGGFYHYCQDVEDIPASIDAMLTRIQNAYIVSFKIKGLPADDDNHQLMINVVDKESSGEAYKHFYAAKVPFPIWLKIVILVLAVLLIVAFVVLTILSRRRERKAMGIGKRRCEECGRRMRDDWEFCPFCRYLKNDRKRKKKKKKEGAEK